MNTENVYEDAINLIRRNPNLQNFVGARTPDLIHEAERTLNLTFPSDYRRFLLEYGCGNFASFEIFGVIHSDFLNSSVPDSVWYTLRERENGLPIDFVIVSNSGDGWLYSLNCAENFLPKGSVAVYALSDHISPESFEVVYSSFSEFLLEGAKAMVASR